MIRLLSFGLALLFASGLQAQQVNVRGGEHDGFTRLVFDVPSGTDWSFEPLEARDGIRLKLDNPTLRFRISNAFEKIGRDRVSALQANRDAPEIDIEFNCECEERFFLLRDRMLVLDVSLPLTTEAEPNEAKLKNGGSATAEVARTPAAHGLSDIRIVGTPGIGPSRKPTSLIPEVSIVQPDAVEGDFDTGGDPNRQPDPQALGESIVADLARAATQGLLEADLEDFPSAEQTLDRILSSSPGTDSLTSVIFPHDAHIIQERSEDGAIVIGATQCIKDSKLRISNWAKDKSLLGVLGGNRLELVGEFDEIDKRALRSYVKSLLHFGFGAEARAAQSMQPDNPDPILTSLSYLVDGSPDPTGYFAELAHCDTNAAFWAALGGGIEEGSARYNEQAILRGFEALPPHLRGFLGARLAEKLAKSGKTEIARDVLRRLERLHGGVTPSLALGMVQIDLQDGEVVDAEKALSSIEALPGQQAPQALTAAIEVARAKDEAVPGDIVQLTAAFASELNGSQEGAELWQAHIRSLLLNRKYDESYEELAAAANIPAEMLRKIENEALSALTQSADDLTFLKFALGQPLRDVGDPSLVLSVLERLLDLGLPDAVLARLDEVAHQPTARDFQRLRAEALLDLSRPEEAEIVLVGLRGDDVIELRAEARRQMGDHEYAGNLFEEMGQRTEALQEAWLSSDWARIAENGDEPLSEAARLTQEDIDRPETLNLGYADELANRSRSSRSILRAMLDATQITDEN